MRSFSDDPESSIVVKIRPRRKLTRHMMRPIHPRHLGTTYAHMRTHVFCTPAKGVIMWVFHLLDLSAWICLLGFVCLHFIPVRSDLWKVDISTPARLHFFTFASGLHSSLLLVYPPDSAHFLHMQFLPPGKRQKTSFLTQKRR